MYLRLNIPQQRQLIYFLHVVHDMISAPTVHVLPYAPSYPEARSKNQFKKMKHVTPPARFTKHPAIQCLAQQESATKGIGEAPGTPMRYEWGPMPKIRKLPTQILKLRWSLYLIVHPARISPGIHS